MSTRLIALSLCCVWAVGCAQGKGGSDPRDGGVTADGGGVDGARSDSAIDANVADGAATIDAAVVPDAALPDVFVFTDVAVPDATIFMDAPPDTLAPGAITTLAATVTAPGTVRLDWTAVGDDAGSGTAAGYDVRFSTTNITSDAEFTAAASAGTPPVPTAAGTMQSMTVPNLMHGTTYFFAIRVRDEVPNLGARSNTASAMTPARARLLVSEVAVSNSATENFDFVELVAVTGGRIDGLVIADSGTTLATLGTLTVAMGERIVVHATGTPCPAGCAQEITLGNIMGSTAGGASATAWDLYSTVNGLTATDNVITVRDGTTIVDAVALSNRDADASMASMVAFAELHTAGAWLFGAAPADTVNDCPTQREAVSVATTNTACSGFDVAGPGLSIQRNGTADTHHKRDFYAAAQTPGLANTGNVGPSVVSVTVLSATQVRVRFTDELAPASVIPGAFSITGLTVSAATLFDVHEVDLTTTAQTPGAPYFVGLNPMLSDLQLLGFVQAANDPASRFCGFAAVPAVIVNEVAPAMSLGSDLIELRVTAAGSLAGMTVRANPSAGSSGTLLGTLPLICGQVGDRVVIHLIPASVTGSAPASETTGKLEYRNSMYPPNYDLAYDVLGSTSTGIAATDVNLTVLAANGTTVLDAVALSDKSGTAVSTAVLMGLLEIQSAGAWLPANCGGVACTATTAESVMADYSTVGSTPAGDTVARSVAGTDTNMASDWIVGAQTLGN